MVRKATGQQIKLSQSVSYDDSQAKSKVCGPWDSYNIESSMSDWNNDVMMWVVNASMIFDEDDHWVKPPQEASPEMLRRYTRSCFLAIILNYHRRPIPPPPVYHRRLLRHADPKFFDRFQQMNSQ
jgi:hypothetical protein